jgi:hypothetical protein
MSFAAAAAGAANVQLLESTMRSPLSGTSGVVYNADGISIDILGDNASPIGGGPVGAGLSVGPSGHATRC